MGGEGSKRRKERKEFQREDREEGKYEVSSKTNAKVQIKTEQFKIET